MWEDAKRGSIDEIPADIRIRTYHTLKRIRKDYEVAPFRPNIKVKVFCGPTGTGKSHRAFEEASDAYIKGSTTKWWDGYAGQKRVIIDEFRGQIAIEHILKWFDKYPCFVEEKGGQLALRAEEFWVCSNKHPRDWYVMDVETIEALLRRLDITVFSHDPRIKDNYEWLDDLIK